MGRHWRPNSFENGHLKNKFELRRVKSHGIIILLAPEFRLLSADAYRDELDARKTLAEMNQYETLAQTWERMKPQSLRDDLARRYRELIGVHPEQRGEFREALGRVKEGGGMSVQDVKDLLRIRG